MVSELKHPVSGLGTMEEREKKTATAISWMVLPVRIHLNSELYTIHFKCPLVIIYPPLNFVVVNGS